MLSDEFTDTYSDDIIYLREARQSLLTHPLRTEIPAYCNASMSRIYAILMIGSIEAMLERWLERDKLEVLKGYFKKGSTNTQRVNDVCSAFISKGINVEKEVFDDYLAIKYIRNAIVHASWDNNSGKFKQDEINWIVSRGFPSDTRKLNSAHWQRFEWVNENMMYYIALAGFIDVPLAPNSESVGTALKPLPDTSGIIAWSEWPRVYWSNLERISETLNQRIEKAINENEKHWSRKISGINFNELKPLQQNRHLLLSAFVSVKNGETILQNDYHLSDNVSMCWNQLTASRPEFNILESETVRSAIKSLNIMHENNIHPVNHIFPELRDDAPFEIHEKLVEACFKKTHPLTVTDIAMAYHLGRLAYRAIPNTMPLKLFSLVMPICAPDRFQEWKEKSQHVSDIYRLSRLWYSSIEGRKLYLTEIDYYQELIQSFSDIA